MTFDLARNPRRLRQADGPAKAADTPQQPIGQNPLWRSLAIGSTAPSPLVQASAEVGAPDDAWEREADAVADRVMRMAVPTSPGEGLAVRAATAGLRVQRVCRAESWYRAAPDYCLDTWFSPVTHKPVGRNATAVPPSASMAPFTADVEWQAASRACIVVSSARLGCGRFSGGDPYRVGEL